ncbi:hypothetical protein [Marinitenerispora sediminis]|uniref:Uncharacterized protein n=1 Tax=Marinitenerispora sediminis TaxID=1931232 RepID=A0A368T5A3_9ACTN|nr:hypothetical protein [Marinitenerispora sediminis]RCV50981.1 hypothetical protein DEF23_21250 [Marinitenerispora sediminis]RCV53225.1 hypothetical protein DEF28_10810 [Marinitenerispora sediminis]RCV54380.1 hypothetical protein DEF24_19365 [Marinitenerispora sediminis]
MTGILVATAGVLLYLALRSALRGEWRAEARMRDLALLQAEQTEKRYRAQIQSLLAAQRAAELYIGEEARVQDDRSVTKFAVAARTVALQVSAARGDRAAADAKLARVMGGTHGAKPLLLRDPGGRLRLAPGIELAGPDRALVTAYLDKYNGSVGALEEFAAELAGIEPVTAANRDREFEGAVPLRPTPDPARYDRGYARSRRGAAWLPQALTRRRAARPPYPRAETVRRGVERDVRDHLTRGRL